MHFLMSLRAPIVAVTLYALSIGASAVRWVPLAPESNQDVSIYIDEDSLGTVDGRQKAWFKYSFKTMQDGPRGIQFRSYLALELFHCENMRQATRTVVFYSGSEPKGVALLKHDLAPLNFEEAPPGTMGALQLSVVCKRSKLTGQ
jgi:hypothetical protein